MIKPIIIKIISGVIKILTCLIAVAIVLFLQDWFGAGDTFTFIFWTVPFALGLALSGHTILSLFRTVSLPGRIFLIVLVSVLLSMGWAYCVTLALGPWIGAFSIPIFYLWIAGSIIQLLFLEWRLPKLTDKFVLSNVLIGLFSLPLTLIVVTILMYLLSYVSSYLTRPEKETYLIPEGYKGIVLVIFNQTNGEKPEYEDGRRIYRIPQSGILFTQLKDEEGIINQEYFYVASNGERRKLGVLDTRDFNKEWTTDKNRPEPPRDSLAIFNPGTMGTMAGSDNKERKVFSELSIGTYNDVKTFEDFKPEYIESLQNEKKKK
jgi:hypothetical protein